VQNGRAACSEQMTDPMRSSLSRTVGSPLCVCAAAASARRSSALTCCDRVLEFLTDDTLVFRSGNTLIFYSVSDRTQQILRIPAGHILDAYAIAPSTQRVAVATHGEGIQVRGGVANSAQSRVTIYAFPSMDIVKAFKCKRGTRTRVDA
jgi:hypothetical protein